MKKILVISAAFSMVLSLSNCTIQKGKDGKRGKDGVSAAKASPTYNSGVVYIDSSQVRKHLFTLASDDMEGRMTGTPGIERAAKYIENEYKKIGLKTFRGLKDYRETFSFTNKRTGKEITTSNILGMLEGKSKKDEFVIVSAHYDHIGMKKEGEGDLVFNGANDNASGVVGLLMLAKYLSKVGTERSVLFACFTAEEMGLIGSTEFAKNIDANKFVAGINLEMIGKEPNTGPKTAWLTGFDRSDFGKIIQKNLEGTGYKLFPDPYLRFNLFFRSDNAPLARLGVPAHTFSTTPIDRDKDYHKVTDNPETLSIPVLTETIKAVAQGTKSIINGKDTPTRVVLPK